MATSYEICVQGVPAHSTTDEAEAIAYAKDWERQGQEASVVMVEQSGSYKSRTPIYPKTGETRTN